VPTPRDRVALVIHLVRRDMDHEAVWRRAMPVVLAGLEEHAVTRSDLLHRASLSLAAAHALGHEDGLAERMGVPRSARSRGEVDIGGGYTVRAAF